MDEFFIFQKKIPGVFAEEIRIQDNFSMSICHVHDTTELMFLLESERDFFIENEFCHLKPGMALMVDPNQLHKGCMISPKSTYHRFLLQIDTKMLGNFFMLPELPDIRSFGSRYSGIAEFSPEDWQQVLVTIEQLKKEITRNTPDGNTLTLLLVIELMTLFSRNRVKPGVGYTAFLNASQDSNQKISSDSYQKGLEIAIYLQNHSAEPCSLDQIAAHFYISRSYLTQIFKYATGFTVTEYLNICRVQKAKALLNKTGQSITEIATQTGFGNVTYFNRVFKQLTDLTPLQYRKQNR